MSAAWNRNRLTEKLGITYPVIQGPLGGFWSQALTAEVSNFGGLGSFGAHGLSPDAIADVIVQIRSRTSKPFAMNLWVSMEAAGVDAIAASGFEAGGHRGSFLRSAEDSLTGTLSLVPQVVDRVSVPVVAAGGIADARGVVAALALGAEGVQMGTAFLSCEGSGASSVHRETLLARQAGQTALTRGFTGRLGRGVRNRLMDDLNRVGTERLPYPLQRVLVRHLSSAAEAAGRADMLPMWAGQSASLSTCTDVVAFLQPLVEEVSAIAGAVLQWSADRRTRIVLNPTGAGRD